MYIDINTNMYTKEYTFVYTLCKDDLYYIIHICGARGMTLKPHEDNQHPR